MSHTLTVWSDPAVANAVADAVGARINEIPITPEKVYAEIKGGSA